MFQISRIAVFALLIGCGPKYHFDRGDTPPWTIQTAQQSGSTIEVVGSSPITSQVQHDRELALRNAKARVARMFSSEVKSKVSLWVLQSNVGDQASNKNLSKQNIQIKSNVKVEDVTVKQNWRDKSTNTHYVLISVDKTKWARKLIKRIKAQISDLKTENQKAKDALGQRKPLTAYKHILKGYEIGASVEPDIAIVDMLQPNNTAAKTVTGVKSDLDGLHDKLREKHPFSLELSCEIPDICADLRTNMESFLNNLGFSLNENRTEASIHIEAGASVKSKKKERVGNRVEHIFSSSGKLKVTEPDGSVVKSLSVSLRPGVYTDRGNTPGEGRNKAFRLGVDTLSSQFRSKFRKEFPTGN